METRRYQAFDECKDCPLIGHWQCLRLALGANQIGTMNRS